MGIDGDDSPQIGGQKESNAPGLPHLHAIMRGETAPLNQISLEELRIIAFDEFDNNDWNRVQHLLNQIISEYVAEMQTIYPEDDFWNNFERIRYDRAALGETEHNIIFMHHGDVARSNKAIFDARALGETLLKQVEYNETALLEKSRLLYIFKTSVIQTQLYVLDLPQIAKNDEWRHRLLGAFSDYPARTRAHAIFPARMAELNAEEQIDFIKTQHRTLLVSDEATEEKIKQLFINLIVQKRLAKTSQV